MFKEQLLARAIIIAGTIFTLFFSTTNSVLADVEKNPPKVPFKYAAGMQKYEQVCASCHGKRGEGSKQGPPLMHPFYKPSHHSDKSFYRAALRGVQAHHWEFGDMSPVSTVTRKDMDAIIPFIRWLQREKGIYKQ